MDTLEIDDGDFHEHKHSQTISMSNESVRTPTPLSFQTFGANDSSPYIQLPNADTPESESVRPSLDSQPSYRSSSPSTAPPMTPTRLDGTDAPESVRHLIGPYVRDQGSSNGDSNTSLSQRSEHAKSHSTRRFLRRRDIHIYGQEDLTRLSPSPFHLSPPPRVNQARSRPSSKQSSDEQSDSTARTPDRTLKRSGKSKPRPALGVITYIASSSAAATPSPLSPVAASPQHSVGPHRVPSPPTTPISAAPSSNLLVTETPDPTEPLSPDITLDLSSAQPTPDQYLYLPKQSESLVSPLGTTFEQPSTKPVSALLPTERKLQFKPRKRVLPGQERRSQDHDATTDHAPKAAFHEEPASKAHVVHFTTPAEVPSISRHGARSSFSRWSISSVRGLKNGVMKRLSRIGSSEPRNSDVSQDVLFPRSSSPIPLSTDNRSPSGSPIDERRQRSTDEPINSSTRPSTSNESGSRPQVVTTGVFTNPFSNGEIIGQRLTTAGSATHTSTITVRTSDGWFSTIPSNEASHLEPSLPTPEREVDVAETRRSSLGNPNRSSLPPPSSYSRASASRAAPLPHLADDGDDSREQSIDTDIRPRHLSNPSVSAHTSRPSSMSTSRPQSHQGHGRVSINSHRDSGAITPNTVRLLDVATAAALRKSIDFDDRVKTTENALRKVLYGADDADDGWRSRPSVRHEGGSHSWRAKRNLSVSESGVIDYPRKADGLSNGGGVFLSQSSLRHRSLEPALLAKLTGSPSKKKARSNSTSRLSNTITASVDGSISLPSASSSQSNRSYPKITTTIPWRRATTDSDSITPQLTAKPSSNFAYPPSPTMVRRMSRKISRIFVGKGTGTTTS